MQINISGKHKKIILAMFISLIAAALFAAADTCSAYAVSQVQYLDAAGVEQTQSDCISVSSVPDSPYPVLGGSDGKAKWYVVDSNVTYREHRLTILGKVNLILEDGFTLNAMHGIRMAANRPEGASLTIYAQSTGDNKGVLKADASQFDSEAGIGGNDSEPGGTITINGGAVTATGGKYGAGIGGGEDRDGGNITINNGTVTATGGKYGAGIGGGEGGSGGTINITGGKVTAQGGYRAAGIGGGQKWRGGGSGGNITISNARVDATAGNDGAGIGGGQDGEGGTITINSGDITASGGRDGRGAGIGGGSDAHAGTITINGGAIRATGGIATLETYGCDGGGAGIGAGYDNDSGSKSKTAGGHVIINGGNIDAIGGCLMRSETRTTNWPGAGIGSGANGYGLRIEIHGGKISAYSPGNYGASIGGGENGSGGHISIDNTKGDPTITTETLRGTALYSDNSHCIGNGNNYDTDDPAIVEFNYPNGKVWVRSDVKGYDIFEKYLKKDERAGQIKLGNGNWRNIKIMPCDHEGKTVTAAEDGHQFSCRYCSAYDGEVLPHECSNDVWDHNDTQHWNICSVCGAEMNHATHTLAGGNSCECGFNFSLKINDGALTINEGVNDESVQVTAEEGITDDQISWTSSDEAVATVEGNGRHVKITAVKEGEAIVTAQAGDLTARCTVTVQHVHRFTKKHTPPTCTEDGTRPFYWCDDETYGCGRTFFDEEGTDEFSLKDIDTQELCIPAYGHLGEWILVKEATQREAGVLRRTCALCDETLTVTTTKANADALVEMLLRAGEAKEGIIASNDGSDVVISEKWAPVSAFDAFEAAVTKANNVKNDLDATQEQLNNAENELMDAVQAFQDEIQNGTKDTDEADGNLGQYIPIKENMTARTQVFTGASEENPVYIRTINIENYPGYSEGTTTFHINSPQTTVSYKRAGSFDELYYTYHYDNGQQHSHRIFRGTLSDGPHLSGVNIAGGKGTRYDPYLLKWNHSLSGEYALADIQQYDQLNGFLITAKDDTSITVKGKSIDDYGGDCYLAVTGNGNAAYYPIAADDTLKVKNLTPATRVWISNDKSIDPVVHVADTLKGTDAEYEVTGNPGGGDVTCYFNAETSDKSAEGWTKWTDRTKPTAPGVYSVYVKVKAAKVFNEGESEVTTFEIYEGEAPQHSWPHPDYVTFHYPGANEGYDQSMWFDEASEDSQVYILADCYRSPADSSVHWTEPCKIKQPEVVIRHFSLGSYEQVWFNDRDDSEGDYKKQVMLGVRGNKSGLSISGGKGTQRDPYILSWNRELSGRKLMKDINQYDKLEGFLITKKTDSSITIKGKGNSGYYAAATTDSGKEYHVIPQTGEIVIDGLSPLSMIAIGNNKSIKPELRIPDSPYGEELVPVVTGNTGQGDVTVYFNSFTGDKDAAGWEIWTETEKPETTGTYYVYADIAATELFNKGQTPVTSFEITKVKYPAPAVPPQAKKIYEDTIELEEIEGCEYRLDGVSVWQKSGVFEDLEPNTEYTFYQRMARDKNHTPSEEVSAVISTSDHAWDQAQYSWDFSNYAKPTVTASRACTKCDLSESETVEPVRETTKEPTCLERGEQTFTATFENPAFTPQVRVYDAIPATGHKRGEQSKENIVEAACTTQGSYQLITRCTVCDAVLMRVYVTEEALGHDWSDWQQITPGEMFRICSRCDEKETVKTHDGEAHDLVRIRGVEPTCTQSGIEEHVKCMDCGRLYTDMDAQVELTSDDVILPATGHNEGAPFNENEVDATCTDEGSCDEVVSCTKCETILSRTYKTNPALGHDWDDPEYTWNETETVTAAHTCKRCEHIEKETADTSSEVTCEPTCTQKGETTYTARFQNHVFTDQTKTVKNIDATGHTWGEANYKWAEDESIVMAFRTCSKCHDNDMAIALVTSEITKEPTSREPGEKTYTAAFKDPFETQIRKEVIPVDLTGAEIVLSETAFTYNGKAQKPTVRTVGGMELNEGTDYTVKWSNASSKNAGDYTVTITGEGNYTGTTTATYTISKAANPMKLKARTATVKYSKLKKKAQALAVKKEIKFIKDAKDKKSYTLSSAKKGSKSFKKYFKINKTTGKVTVKKGLKKGTYKVKVKVRALGNSKYKASGKKSVTFKIKVQ